MNHSANKLAVVLCLAILALPVCADTIFGSVVNVHDGDTITVLDANKTQHKIRLTGIDAPELGQAYGRASRDHLAQSVAGRAVRIEWSKRDKYQRIVGKVVRGEKDICLEQVVAGMAWHYVKYINEQPGIDQISYAIAEDQARERKLGLWQDATPTPPWGWRAAHKVSTNEETAVVAGLTCDLSQSGLLEHSGGLNACGCHFNRKTGACHCHRAKGCGCSCQPATCN